jgi:hypothetical protein
MYARFYAPGSGMSWLHNQDIEPQLFTMTLGIGAAGVVTYMPPGGMSGAPYGTLMGRRCSRRSSTPRSARRAT